MTLAEHVAQVEREAITAALVEHRYNGTAVAYALGISRETLYRKMRRLGIKGRNR